MLKLKEEFMGCLCYSDASYALCCEPYHNGELPETPEQLMRSRYSAYSLSLIDYIVETTHSKSRPIDIDAWKKKIGDFCRETSFAGLVIDDAAPPFVTFTASLVRNGVDVSFCEKSLFAKENGRWVYVEGTVTPVRSS